jgi:hypothetical protein
MAAPVETKVTAATAGAGVGAVLSTFILWALDALVFKGAGVPEALVGVVTVVVSALSAYIAGWQAKHTTRPDLAAETLPHPQQG